MDWKKAFDITFGLGIGIAGVYRWIKDKIEWDEEVDCARSHLAQDPFALHKMLTNSRIWYRSVDEYIAAGADLNAFDEHNKSLLIYAQRFSGVKLTKMLLKAGADVNARDKDGKTILFFICDDKIDLAKLLIQRGADVNIEDNNGDTPLHLAAFKGHADICNSLLDAGANIAIENARKFTPLHVAVLGGNKTIVEILIDRGADINCLDSDKQTPLFFAVVSNKPDIFEYLIDRGADYHLNAENNTSPMHVAANTGNIAMIALLVKAGLEMNSLTEDGEAPIHVAARAGQQSTVQYFLNKGIDVNFSGDDGWTALHEASNKGEVETVKFLLKNNARIGLWNQDNITPLHLAAIGGHKDAIQALLSKSYFPSTWQPGESDGFNEKREEIFSPSSLKEQLLNRFASNPQLSKEEIASLPIDLQESIVKFVSAEQELFYKNGTFKFMQSLLFAHGQRHLARLKEVLAQEDVDGQTAQARTPENAHEIKDILHAFESCERFEELPEEIRELTLENFRKRLGLDSKLQ